MTSIQNKIFKNKICGSRNILVTANYRFLSYSKYVLGISKAL